MNDLEEGTYTLLLAPYSYGGEYSVTVYCSSPRTELEFLGWGPANRTALGECQGDCDSDDECEGDLVCFYNDAFETNVPDGCIGTAYDHVDYCHFAGTL